MTATGINQTLQATPLRAAHEKRDARMVDFSGWWMPLQYGKVVEEHMAVRNAAGLFDISHMGLVSVKSGNLEKTRDFLNALVPQDLTKLYPGKAVYTQFLNEQGGIIDDVIVYQMPQTTHFTELTEFLVIVNAANAERDMAWMKQHRPDDGIELNLLYDRFSLIALQGPAFSDILTMGGIHPDELPARFHIAEVELKLHHPVHVLIARTGYTGEDGVELIVPNAHAEAVWDKLLHMGESKGLVPVGLAARDTLRLEAAYPLHGHDINEEYTPLEAGLGWSVKLKQEADFIGKAALLRQKEEGAKRRFICFKLSSKTIARQHDAILKNGKPVGEVTSGSISPLLNEPIGMGYCQSDQITGPGDTIEIKVRNRTVEANIVERPFYKG